MRIKRLLLTVVAGMLAAFCVQAESLSLRGVSVQRIDLVADPVPWVSLKEALLLGEVMPDGPLARAARTTRAPAAGQEFLVLTMRLKPGFSIGRMDFKLRAGADSYECLAMAAASDAPFDPRLLEIRAEGRAESLRLLFEIPQGTEAASLVFALPTTLSVPELALPLRESASEAPGEESADEGGDSDKESEGAADAEGAARREEQSRHAPGKRGALAAAAHARGRRPGTRGDRGTLTAESDGQWKAWKGRL